MNEKEDGMQFTPEILDQLDTLNRQVKRDNKIFLLSCIYFGLATAGLVIAVVGSVLWFIDGSHFAGRLALVDLCELGLAVIIFIVTTLYVRKKQESVQITN